MWLCSCPMPVCDEWRTNGALNLASVIFARKHWIFNWIWNFRDARRIVHKVKFNGVKLKVDHRMMGDVT